MTWTDFKKKHQLCAKAITYIDDLGLEDCSEIIKALREDGERWWTIWGLTRLLTGSRPVSWAIFSAELVVPIYEAQRPNDPGPRQALEAAKRNIRYIPDVNPANCIACVAADTDSQDTIDDYVRLQAAHATMFATCAAASYVAYAWSYMDSHTDPCVNAVVAATKAAHYAGVRHINKIILDEGMRLLKEQSESLT
jgi:hypothetical protein